MVSRARGYVYKQAKILFLKGKKPSGYQQKAKVLNGLR